MESAPVTAFPQLKDDNVEENEEWLDEEFLSANEIDDNSFNEVLELVEESLDSAMDKLLSSSSLARFQYFRGIY